NLMHRHRRMLGTFPSPLWGGAGVGVVVRGLGPSMDPPPQPSPTRGEGERGAVRARALHCTLILLPHIADGSQVASFGTATRIASRTRSVTTNGSTPKKIVD